MEGFEITKIPDSLLKLMKGKSYPDGCWVPKEDLRVLNLLYYDFDNNVQQGQIVCNKYISEDLQDIFQKLYLEKYQLYQVKPIDMFNGDDVASCTANNCSCFNFRDIAGEEKISLHALGLAIDINPLQNPMVLQKEGQNTTDVLGSEPYIDRTKDYEHKIDENDLVYRLFKEKGFEWGGTFADYQHFYVNDSFLKVLYPNLDKDKSVAENAEAAGSRNKKIVPLYKTMPFKVLAVLLFIGIMLLSMAFALAPTVR